MSNQRNTIKEWLNTRAIQLVSMGAINRVDVFKICVKLMFLDLDKFKRLPSDAGGLTPHKPSSFPTQMPCPWPHRVPHKCCLPLM